MGISFIFKTLENILLIQNMLNKLCFLSQTVHYHLTWWHSADGHDKVKKNRTMNRWMEW